MAVFFVSEERKPIEKRRKPLQAACWLCQDFGGCFILILAGVEFVIVTLHRQQLRMGALFHDPTVFDHKDQIGTTHRGQPVGNHEGRSALRDALHGRLNLRFGHGINGSADLGCHPNGQRR